MSTSRLLRRCLATAAVASVTAGCGVQTAPMAPPSASAAQGAVEAGATPTASVSLTATDPATAAPQPTASALTAQPTQASSDASAGVATVPGYAVGQFPAVPLFSLPDTSVLNTGGQAMRDKLAPAVKDVPGLRIQAVSCAADGSYRDSASGLVLYGDGSGSYSGADGTVTRDGLGGEVISTAGESITKDGRGGGTYSSAAVTITNAGDGSGTYSTSAVTVTLDGKGAGTYSDAGVTITNAGDGSGTYSDAGITITNDGHGHATVSSAHGTWLGVPASPLAPVPKLGKFPPIDSVRPRANNCGFVITVADGVLFDFDKHDLRAEASGTLDKLSVALKGVTAKQVRVSGHTDAIGTEAYNQTLSEQRAAAVVAGLEGRGVVGSVTSVGFGKTKPVAPNTLNGQDNPAGRQLNRRVEIFVKA